MSNMLYLRFYGNVTFVVITFGLLLTIKTSICDDGGASPDTGEVHGNASVNNTQTHIKDKETKEKASGEKSRVNDNVKNKTSEKKNPESDNTIPSTHIPSLTPGALQRGFYVFVGLSVLVVVYLMFRSSRLGKSPAQMVRKYGVLAHKQDLEMRPLPLDEDDEDDTTVFDVSGLSPQRGIKHPAS